MMQVTIPTTSEAREMLRELSAVTEIPQVKLSARAIKLLYKVRMPKEPRNKCTCGLGDDWHETDHPVDCPAHTGF